MDILTPLWLLFWLVVLFALPPLPFSLVMFRREGLVARSMLAFAAGLLSVSTIGYVLRAFFTFSVTDLLSLHIIVWAILGGGAVLLRISPLAPTYFRKTPLMERDLLIGKFVTFPTAVLLIAIILAVYTRMMDPLTRYSLNATDPFIHMQVIIDMDHGLGESAVGHEYHMGFHFIIFTLYRVSGADVYSIFRYTGALLGVLSVLSVYGLVSSVSRREVGALSALMFASFPLFARWFAWQTLTMPEVAGLTVLPLVILLSLRLLDHLGEDLLTVVVYFLSVTGMMMAMLGLHWLTLTAAIYASVFILVASPLVHRRRMLTWRSSFVVGVLVSIGITSFVLYRIYSGIYSDYSSPYDFVRDVLIPKRFDITVSNAFGMVMILVAGITGFVRRKASHILLTGASLFLGLMHITGMFYPSGIQYRVGSFFTLMVAVCLGILVHEFMTKEGLYLLLATTVRKVKAVPYMYLAHLHYALAVGFIAGYGAWLVTASASVFAAVTLLSVVLLFVAGKWIFSNTSPFFGEDLDREEEGLDRYVDGIREDGAGSACDGGTGGRGGPRRVRGSSHVRPVTNFMILVVLLFVLMAIFPPPIAVSDSYHYGYDGVARAALLIRDDDMALENVTVYHQSVMLDGLRRDRVYSILYPDVQVLPLTELVSDNATSFVPGGPERPTVFIFIEKIPFPRINDLEANKGYEVTYELRTEAELQAGPWIREFMRYHQVTVYFEDPDILVYRYIPGD